MIRTSLLTLTLGVAVLGSNPVHAAASHVPVANITPASLQYGGAILHPGGWAGHTFLAPTEGECNAMVANYDHANLCDVALESRQYCSRRSMFEMRGPSNPQGDVVTTTISVPSRFLRDLGELRRRYDIEQYEADVLRLGDK